MRKSVSKHFTSPAACTLITAHIGCSMLPSTHPRVLSYISRNIFITFLHFPRGRREQTTGLKCHKFSKKILNSGISVLYLKSAWVMQSNISTNMPEFGSVILWNRLWNWGNLKRKELLLEKRRVSTDWGGGNGTELFTTLQSYPPGERQWCHCVLKRMY